MNTKGFFRLIALFMVFNLVACQATATPTAIATRILTVTPTRTSTATSLPTATPLPTNTPIPTPTPTPIPTPVPSLTGRVKDTAKGQGIAGATVEARLAESPLGSHWGYSIITASDGNYTFFRLPAGDYIVRVTAPGYAREYWDNVTPSNKAIVVKVSPGKTITGIDFALTEGGFISGHIYLSDGKTPIAEAQVLVRPSKYTTDDGFWATTDAEGSYRVEGLSLGNYKVKAESPGFTKLRYYNGAEGAYDWLQAADVTVVPPANTLDVNINLHLAASVSGHVYQSNGITPFANANINAEEQLSSVSLLEGFNTTANGEGYYILEGLRPGSYWVNAFSPGFAHLWYDSKPNPMSADLLTVTEGAVVTGIDFSLNIAGILRGHVYNEEGDPIPGIDLVADFKSSIGSWAAFSTTDSSGAYELWLGTGDYYIKYWTNAPDYVLAWYKDAYRVEDAKLVHIEAPAEVSGIDFHLSRAGSISGYVYEADGITPIPSANVYAYPIVGSHPGAGANTSSDGSFTIMGLPSGSYVVQVTVSGHVMQYYNNASEKASATVVIVKVPNDTPGINFLLSQISK